MQIRNLKLVYQRNTQGTMPWRRGLVSGGEAGQMLGQDFAG